MQKLLQQEGEPLTDKRLTPYTYQEEAIQFASSRTGAIIALDCGLGKTLVGIETAKRLRKTSNWRCLVIVPPSLIPQWVKFISEQDPEGPIITVPGRIPYDYKQLSGWIVQDYYALYHQLTRERIQSVLWDIVILDEGHRIKNRSSKISQYVRRLNRVRGVILTATPMEQGPVDLWALLNFVDKPRFPAFHAWTVKNLEVKDNYWGGKIYGNAKDPEAFGRMVDEFIHRKTKKEAVPELPARIDIPTRVDMTADQLALYNEIKNADDIEVDVEDQTLLIQNVLTLITRLQQVSTDPSLLGFKAKSGKLEWLEEFLDDHPNERVVVFTRFRDTALNLSAHYRAPHIVGGNRSDTFDEETFDLLFGTIDAMGEGLNLQRATTAVFLDGHWSTIKMTQAYDRIHRVNIKEPRNVYLLNSCREDIIVYKAVTKKWSKQQLVYEYLKS